jgi:hypothetical protein
VHAERLVHKLDTFTDLHRAAQQRIRDLIWRFYGDLNVYQAHPSPQRRAALRARFDRIFRRRTDFVTLDRLLARLHANKPELLLVLDRPRSRSTPTDRRTTSAAKSPSERSAAAPAATPAAIAAMPFSGSPRPVRSSALPSGTISAIVSPSQVVRQFPFFQTSSSIAANLPDGRDFCCSYKRLRTESDLG